MVYNAVLSWQINLMSIQIIFIGLQILKRILKELGLCANRDIQYMGFCLLFAEDGVVDDAICTGGI